jgi:hypothetical protein
MRWEGAMELPIPSSATSVGGATGKDKTISETIAERRAFFMLLLPGDTFHPIGQHAIETAQVHI